VRASHAVGAAPDQVSSKSTSPVDELIKLADMLEKGLLTRNEFDLMKAKITDL
jgi:hypothetical protein